MLLLQVNLAPTAPPPPAMFTAMPAIPIGLSAHSVSLSPYPQGSGSDSPTMGKGGKNDKRAHHNALERKRRDHIKDSFSVLRDSVPALAGEKVRGMLRIEALN